MVQKINDHSQFTIYEKFGREDLEKWSLNKKAVSKSGPTVHIYLTIGNNRVYNIPCSCMAECTRGGKVTHLTLN